MADITRMGVHVVLVNALKLHQGNQIVTNFVCCALATMALTRASRVQRFLVCGLCAQRATYVFQGSPRSFFLKQVLFPTWRWL